MNLPNILKDLLCTQTLHESIPLNCCMIVFFNFLKSKWCGAPFCPHHASMQVWKNNKKTKINYNLCHLYNYIFWNQNGALVRFFLCSKIVKHLKIIKIYNIIFSSTITRYNMIIGWCTEIGQETVMQPFTKLGQEQVRLLNKVGQI